MTASTKKSVPEKRTTAKLFMHGRSQAVRLPKEFRFEGTEVRVRREGRAVVLEPIAHDRASIETVWNEIDTIRQGEDLFPKEGFDDPPAGPDPRSFFER
ncbi:MAG: AbrB/MazE/SpoVT family DNA-binding domain-containing protein [Methylobacteriaceae bacterium]|nr:AbrB/MazE/SpoVT family DNA-binding domain-containing protein [Methylobacteriaceae bacterium]